MSPIARFLAYGFAGWVLENATNERRRYSRVFGGKKIPLLPVYGLGGLALGALSKEFGGESALVRAAIYGSALTGIEYFACRLDRTTGGKSWAYPNSADGAGCVDLAHALAWMGLGLLVEPLAK